MSFLRGRILVALPLGVILIETVCASCVLKCETDSGCAGTVARLTGKECREILKSSHHDKPSVPDFVVSWSKQRSNVSWSRDTNTDTSVVLLLPKRGGHRMCFNITIPKYQTNKSEDTDSRVTVECKRVGATVKGRFSYLFDSESHVRLARTRVKGLRKSCDCKVPEQVHVNPYGGLGVVVDWKWDRFGSSNSVMVGIVSVNDTDSFVSSISLNVTQVQYDFKDFNASPGTYIAMVGSVGCSRCKRLRQSAEFQWPEVSAKRRSRNLCSCWTPERVIMVPLNDTNIIVHWEDFYNEQDLTVGIVNKEDTDTFVVSKHIARYNLIDHVQEFNFDFIKPAGTYIALVGSTGCASCMRYRESEPLRWPTTETTTEYSTNATTTSPQQLQDPKPAILTVVLIAVGVMTCISALTAVMVIYHRKSCKNTYHQLSRNPPNVNYVVSGNLQDVNDILVLRHCNDDDSYNSSDRIVSQIRLRGKTATSKLLSDYQLSNEDVILYVTIGSDVTLPERLKTMADKSVVVVVSNIPQTPMVHIPGMFKYRTDLPNNRTSLELDAFLNLFGYVEVEPMIPDAEPTIYLVAGDDDGLHTQVAEQLAVLLRKTFFRVVFAQDTENLREQRSNPVEWSKRQVDASTYTVVIASKDITTTRDFRDSLCNITKMSCSAMDRVIDLSSRQRQSKVILVSLGYWTDCLGDLKNLHLQECRTFTLVHHVHGSGPELNLRPFLSHLCRKGDMVERICSEPHPELLDKVKLKLEGMRETPC